MRNRVFYVIFFFVVVDFVVVEMTVMIFNDKI